MESEKKQEKSYSHKSRKSKGKHKILAEDEDDNFEEFEQDSKLFPTLN